MINLYDADDQKPERYQIPDRPELDPQQAFLEKLREYGLDPGAIEPTGELVRFDVDKKGDEAGWYVFHPDNVPSAAFGCWKTDVKETWCSKDRRELTPEEIARHEAYIKQAKAKREKEKRRRNAIAREKADKIWNNAEEVITHPYLTKKGIGPHGLRQSRENLIVPLRDEKGILHNLQIITPEGKKRFLTGGRVKGCSFTIPGNDKLAVVEGVATGASVNGATGATAICAFNDSNMVDMAELFKAMDLQNTILFCADNDRFTAGNPGVKYAERAAKICDGSVVFPVFDNIPNGNDPIAKYTDFNDLAALAGLDVVAQQIQEPAKKTKLPPLTPITTHLKSIVTARPAPLEYIYNCNGVGLIPKGVVGILTATGGTGKTFFLLNLAVAAAMGENFGPIQAPRPLKVLVIVGEDSQEEMVRRTWDICKGKLPENLFATSVYGELGPLMRLEGSTPVYNDAYYWLDETISNHGDIDIVFLDPLSRFYGLDENNSTHATAFITAIESLNKKHTINSMLTHHTGKAAAAIISQNMARGSGALVDGCRWQAGLVRMSPEMAQEFDLESPRDYVVFDAPKSNYAPDMQHQLVFKRGENGVLEHVEPWRDQSKKVGLVLLEKLKRDPDFYTFNELCNEKKCGELVREIKEEIPSFKRKPGMEKAIKWLIAEGLVVVESVGVGRKKKEIVVVL